MLSFDSSPIIDELKVCCLTCWIEISSNDNAPLLLLLGCMVCINNDISNYVYERGRINVTSNRVFRKLQDKGYRVIIFNTHSVWRNILECTLNQFVNINRFFFL